MFFRNKRCTAQVAPVVVVVALKTVMTYLGIQDETWSFAPHFEAKAIKRNKVAAALSQLMPNLGGPSEIKRHLCPAFRVIVRSLNMR